MEEFIDEMSGSPLVKVFIIAVLMDIIFGSLRCVKERKWNSTVGINGMLRKAGMIIAIFGMKMVDECISFNLLALIPEKILDVINIHKVGLCEFFGIMYILYEATSILKNMALIGMPVSKKFNKKLEEWLKRFTSELDGKERK